jgi:hypothetical protein
MSIRWLALTTSAARSPRPRALGTPARGLLAPPSAPCAAGVARGRAAAPLPSPSVSHWAAPEGASGHFPRSFAASATPRLSSIP